MSLFPTSPVSPGQVERSFSRQGITKIIGVDEAGRGALFGPVVAAAVALPEGHGIVGLADSKQLDPRTRDRLAVQVKERCLAWGIGQAGVEQIATVNILQATFVAMRQAVSKVVEAGVNPQLVLVDGPHAVPDMVLPQKALVKGDQRSVNIAAASILAKTYRDDLIVQLAKEYPGYGLQRHKGYGTARHRAALHDLGLTPLHRKQFCKNFLDDKHL